MSHAPTTTCAWSSIENESAINQAIETLQSKGAVFLENCIKSSLIHAAHQHFLSNQANKPRGELEKYCLKVGNERFMFTLELSGPFLDPGIYAAPGILAVVEGLLGKDCIIQSMTVVCAFPGSRLQHVHTDHPLLFPEVGGFNALCPAYAVTVAIPLIELNETTGTTALWEGSHRTFWITEKKASSTPTGKELEGSVMPWSKPGNCYVMDIRLKHAGTPNVSDKPRPILYIVYSRPWFEDRRNFDLQAPIQISRNNWEKIPEAHKPLFRSARFSKT